MLRNRGFDGLSTTSFVEINNEIEMSCPLFHKVLSAMIEADYNTDKKLAAMALIYSIIMFRRCHEMSRLQRVNTILLADGGATRQVIILGYVYQCPVA